VPIDNSITSTLKNEHESKSFYEFSFRKKVQSKHGKKLWESKDEKLWIHDLFDELITRDESFSTQAGFAPKLFP
jgi:hypothetical protein